MVSIYRSGTVSIEEVSIEEVAWTQAPRHFTPLDAGSSEDLPKGSSDAGWLGMPFTEVEDEEDWVGYVDWTALAASTGESSS